MTNLKVDWIKIQDAKKAVELWHYSKNLNTSKSACLGVWEDNIFIGAVVFSPGSCNTLGKRFCLEPFQICELIRVALKNHINPVTKILARCLKMIKKQYPKLKLVISFADQNQNHLGIIYQAGNWIYCGMTESNIEYLNKNGRKIHPRNVCGGDNDRYDHFGIKKYASKNLIKKKVLPKYRYTYILDKEDKILIERIEKIRLPYPKRACQLDGPEQPVQGGGSIPTQALSLKEERNG